MPEPLTPDIDPNHRPLSIFGMGTIVVDHQVVLDSLPEADTKGEVIEDRHQVGGPVPTALCLLQKFGLHVAFQGKWSNDPFGRMIETDLQSQSIEFDANLCRTAARTGFAHVWVEKGTGRRSIAAYRGSHPVEPQDLMLERLAQFDALHLDGWSTTAALSAAATMKQSGRQVFLDLGSPKTNLQQLLHRTAFLTIVYRCNPLFSYFAPIPAIDQPGIVMENSYQRNLDLTHTLLTGKFIMSKQTRRVNRRQFVKTVAGAGALLASPQVIPSSALGKDGAIPPSERIVLGGIGIGNRGTYDLGCFLQQPDVQFVAICDVKEKRRVAVKQIADQKYNNTDCDKYRDFRELLDRQDIDAVLIATGPNWHATAAIHAARAGKDMYCEKPCTKNISQSLLLAETMHRCGRVFQAGTQRRNLPHFAFACELARTGRLGKLRRVYAHPAGMTTKVSGWLPPEDAPPIEVVDWDMYLGPAAWRPFNHKMLNGFHFEKGGGFMGCFEESGQFSGGGVLEWGSHCVDLCQWAANADHTAPVEYNPPENGEIVSTYADGVQLILREKDWLPLGSCPVRFEGDDGWIETGDSGKFVLSSPALLAGRTVEEIGGYPATFHVRDFLDCVKTRSQPKGNAETACYAHIACHAANIALYLGRKVKFDPVLHLFPDDDQANRLRGEALRAPWRL